MTRFSSIVAVVGIAIGGIATAKGQSTSPPPQPSAFVPIDEATFREVEKQVLQLTGEQGEEVAHNVLRALEQGAQAKASAASAQKAADDAKAKAAAHDADPATTDVPPSSDPHKPVKPVPPKPPTIQGKP